MTESYYEHPGNVREAKNFRCCHCPKTFSTPQGLCGHLYCSHKIKAQDIQYQRDWEITDRIADDNEPMPAINRNISTFSGDKKMKTEKELTHKLECIVQGCGKVYSSASGMSVHQRRAHGQGSKIDVNWRWTKEPVTYKNKSALASQARKGIGGAAPTEQLKPKRKYIRQQPVVLTPDSKTIEIAAVIRVPISIGQAEIVQENDLRP